MRYLLLFMLTSLCAAEIKLGKSIVNVEIADTVELRKRGLSGRTSVAEGSGMLFIFDSPQICSFWMKDTKVPLSVGFFDTDKKLIERIDMFPPDTSKKLTVYKSSKPAQYALEVPSGWFRKNQIQPGETFEWVGTPPSK